MTDSREMRIVGRRVPQRDARDKVTGSHVFATDFSRPGMLHGRILRSPIPHGRIRKIDTSRAEDSPGVVGVITHRDAPKHVWHGVWYNYQGCVMDDRVRFVGDEVAAVAAIDVAAAERALKLIEVDYEPLPAVFDTEAALKPDAPQLHPEGNARRPVVVQWGDVAAGLAEAPVVVEGAVSYDSQSYAPIGRNACIAEWSGDQVTVWTSTQTPSECRDSIAEGLDIPLHKLRLISLPSSCSFGLWWVNNFHLITVLLAKKVGRPVKIELDQDECFVAVKRRHLEKSRGKLGCDKDGRILAVDVEHRFDNGGYGFKPDVGFLCPDLWRAPHGRYRVQGVSTNLLTAGCMRGVGDVTLAPFVERLVDMAAEKVGLDPVEMRLRNYVRAGDQSRKAVNYWAANPQFENPPTVTHSSAGVDQCLREGAVKFGFRDKWAGWGRPYYTDGPIRRAVGAASGIHSSGVTLTGGVSAVVQVNVDGTVSVAVSVGRMGQGTETTQAQIAAEALGVPFDDVIVIPVDSNACPWGHGSVSSTAAHRSGFAVREAALDARRQLLRAASEMLRVPEDELAVVDGVVSWTKDGQRRVSIGEVVKQIRRESLSPPVIVGRPAREMPAHMTARNFAAHFAEVEADVGTGEIRLIGYLCAQDSGTVINPSILENQMVGGAVLGSGFALREGLRWDETGRIINGNFLDYKVLRAPDFPRRCETLFAEVNDPLGPFGAKGAGECPVSAAVAAVQQAAYNAVGVWMDVPMTPERVLRALGKVD